MTEPCQKPGLSKQDYATPPEFIDAAKQRLGIRDFAFDLAADMWNTKAEGYFTKEQDSLSQNWWHAAGVNHGWLWLNPPYADITPWAKKCSETTGVNIAFLVPAAVGSNWFRDYVDGKAHVLLLNGRLSFDGIAPYPKDCILCLYGPFRNGYEVWDWRKA